MHGNNMSRTGLVEPVTFVYNYGVLRMTDLPEVSVDDDETGSSDIY